MHTGLADCVSWWEFHADEAVHLNPLHLCRILQVKLE
jgi:hypothetical protein